MSDDKRKMGMNFTEGELLPLFVRFLFPFLIANILNNVYNAVDMIIIGQYVGTTGTAAISIGGRMLNAYSLVGLGLAAGGQVYVSQLIGSGKREKINSAVGTTISVLGIFAVFFSIITIVLSKKIMVWLNVSDNYYTGALNYMIITSIGLPLLYGYNGVSCILRGMGDSKHPLLFIAIAAVLNLVLDVLFVAFFDMAEAGAALATVIGQGISLALSAKLLYKDREKFGFDFKLSSFKIEKKLQDWF